MDRLHQMEVFVAVAECASFARAGQRLHISPPAVTRAVSGLEDRLGARLFNRTTRRLSLTEAGGRYLESARRLLGEIDMAEKDAVGETTVPHGHLGLTAPVTFGRRALSPVVSDFLAAHPGMTASLNLADRVVNLVEEGIDAGIRIGTLPDSSLIARPLGEVRRVLVASPGYIARRGTPVHPGDIRQHAMIAFSSLMPNREWRFSESGRASRVSFTPQYEVNDALAAIDAAELGAGITVALSYMVAEKIRAGLLLEVLGGFAPPPVPVSVVYPQGPMVPAKVRAFIDFSRPRLSAVLGDLALPRQA